MALAEKILRRIGINLAFSQEGEDLVIARLFKNRPTGYYVDVGGHHPWRYSNTALLYARGWKGVVIEPNPRARILFRLLRSRDRFVSCAVGSERGFADYNQFRESALNSLDLAVTDERRRLGYEKVGVRSVQVRTLDDILEEYCPTRQINLLSIDVEGHEASVLSGFDIGRWRPEAVCIEIMGGRMDSCADNGILATFARQGYRPFSKFLHSWLLVANDSRIWDVCG